VVLREEVREGRVEGKAGKNGLGPERASLTAKRDVV
jgi:hypothetical protein